MKTLLAIINDPTDSDPFLKYIIQMADDLQLNLHLLYIQDPQTYPIGSTGAAGAAAIQFERNLEKEREDTLDRLKGQVDNFLRKLSFQMKVDYSAETGSRNMIAEKYVENGKCDMLVLEGQEETNFWSLHATNMDIVLQVECPVWIIPKPSEYKAFRKIIYATDYHEEDIDTLKNLIGLTYKYSPKIIALHVLKSSDFHARVMSSGFQDMIGDQTEYEDIQVKTIKEESEGDIGKTVNHFSAKENADLLVILKENRGFFERIFKPSLTNRILTETELPVLVFHEKR